MADSSGKSVVEQVQTEVKQLLESKGLPFQSFLPREKVEAALKDAGIENQGKIYTPLVTIWAFLSQVLTFGGSCQTAVARVIAARVQSGQKPCSENTASYCTARAKLPERVISDLAKAEGNEWHDQAPVEWKLHGRDVVIVDGSTVTCADTEENQKEYPQSRNQKQGLGSPIVRFVVLLSLAVGTVLQCAIGPCRGKKTGEQNLFRQLSDQLKEGTILLGDCLYDAYIDIAKLQQRKIDVVFGKKQSRKSDFRRGRRLGADDHVVIWTKPKYHKSRFESREEWDALPANLEMREARIILKRKGYKTRVIMVVTTLLDAEQFTKADIMGLFSQRWHCELDLRSIKRSLGMSELKCKTPEMVRKELWMYLLAYNLIRARMAKAALAHNKRPRTLSFQSAKTFINVFLYAMEHTTPETYERLEQILSRAISRCNVGDRPDRKEPRAVKKRVQKYPNLKKPRAEARKGLPA